MKQIWAPWRMKYIDGEKDGTCFLCKAASMPPGKDDENLVLARREHGFIIMNRFPYNNGHLLVAPVSHVGQPEELPEEEMKAVMSLIGVGKRLLDEALKPEGYNIGCNLGGIAGAGVPGHLHIHIVPRWSADTNFMPVVAGTRVISEAIEETFGKLKGAHAQVAREDE